MTFEPPVFEPRLAIWGLNVPDCSRDSVEPVQPRSESLNVPDCSRDSVEPVQPRSESHPNLHCQPIHYELIG